VKAERNVLAEVHNPYVVKLLYSFQVGGLVHHVCMILVSPRCSQLYSQPCSQLQAVP
jgi:hypothetical protein